MSMSKTRRLQVLIEDDQWRRLEAAAVERGVSVAAVVREAIDEKLPVSPEERRRAAEAVLAAEPMAVPDPEDLRRELDDLRARRR